MTVVDPVLAPPFFTTAHVKYTTTMAVHLRSTPAWSGTSLAVVAKGSTVQLTGKTSGAWKQVTSGTTTGWIAGDYLKPVSK